MRAGPSRACAPPTHTHPQALYHPHYPSSFPITLPTRAHMHTRTVDPAQASEEEGSDDEGGPIPGLSRRTRLCRKERLFPRSGVFKVHKDRWGALFAGS